MTPNEPQFLPDRLRLRRQELGLTQEEVAERTGTNQSTISQLERGEQTPTLRSLVLLTQALGTSIEWLLGMTDTAYPYAEGEAGLDDLEREAVSLLRLSDPTQRSQMVEILRIVVSLSKMK